MGVSSDMNSTMQAGLIISKTLFDLGEKAGAAGIEAIQMVAEITLLNSNLSQVRTTIIQGQSRRYAIGATVIIQKILERCQKVYDELEMSSKRMTAGIRLMEDLAMRVRCEFERSEVKILKATLQASSITLHLMQHTLGVSRRETIRR